MRDIAKRNLVNALIAAIVVMVLTLSGIPNFFGAHPFWGMKIAYFGVIAGIIVYSFAWVWQGGWGAKAILFVALLFLSIGVTTFGKIRFAASYAEDAMAGRMWYFGWIAIAAMVFVVLLHLLSTRR